MSAQVTQLAVTPIKGTRLLTVDEVELGREGARGDRRFFIIDGRDRMVNGKTVGELSEVIASCRDDVLRLEFPHGHVVEDEVHTREIVTARFYSRQRDGRIVDGPFGAALSEHVGRPLRLLEAVCGVDRGRAGGVSLISEASLARLAGVGGMGTIDSRRFRMLVEVRGPVAHEEDQWLGREVRIGAATIRVNGHVGRCLITSRHAESGRIDVPTLDILGEYRRELDSTEPLPFGIYGEVREPAVIRVGDPVAPID